jgi:transposase-like protein
MEAALADLTSSDALSISEAARKHGVRRSALSRRFNLAATSSAYCHDSTRLLNSAQEKKLLKYNRRLCERCLSPTLIYKAVSGNLRDTWLNDFVPSKQGCYFPT